MINIVLAAESLNIMNLLRHTSGTLNLVLNLLKICK